MKTQKLRRDIEDKFLNEPALSKLVSLINELRASGFYAKALEYSDTLSELEQLCTTLGETPGKLGGGVTEYLNRMPEINAMLEIIISDELYDFSKAERRYAGAPTGSGYTHGLPERTPDAFVKSLSAIEQLLNDLADLCRGVNSDLSGVNYSSRYGTSTTFLILEKTFAQASKEFHTNYTKDLANATKKLEQVTETLDTDVVYKGSPPI